MLPNLNVVDEITGGFAVLGKHPLDYLGGLGFGAFDIGKQSFQRMQNGFKWP